jgi:hypothetical protein
MGWSSSTRNLAPLSIWDLPFFSVVADFDQALHASALSVVGFTILDFTLTAIQYILECIPSSLLLRVPLDTELAHSKRSKR